MLEGAGFEVVDLGINTDADKFIAALEEHKPDILGMSALLTTTMPYMKVVIQTLKDRGIRDDYIVLVGGAPLNEEFGAAVGADAYCRDAGVAAETAAGSSTSAAPVPPDGRSAGDRLVIVGCGALARETARRDRRQCPDIRRRVRRLPACTCARRCIADAVAGQVRGRSAPGMARDVRIFVAYADCGTGGMLDAVLRARVSGWKRLPGAHCYEFFAGAAAFAAVA